MGTPWHLGSFFRHVFILLKYRGILSSWYRKTHNLDIILPPSYSLSSSVIPQLQVAVSSQRTMAESQLRALAAEITRLADSFAGALEEKGLPEANFSVDSPIKHEGITAEMFMTRQALCDKLSDMWYLVQGPSESIYNYVHNVRRKPPFNRLLNTEFFLKPLCIGYSGRCLSQRSQPLQLLGYRASRWLCVLFRDRRTCLATGRCCHQDYSTCYYLTPV